VAFKVWPERKATPAKPWYSWAAGLMTIVVWSSAHDFTIGSEQWLWLNTTLAAVDREITPWLLVTTHRPMYLSAEADDSTRPFWQNSRMFVQHLESLYVKYNVTFTMSGHHHSTQRSCSTINYTCAQHSITAVDGFSEYQDPELPIHWLIGNTGANPDNITNMSAFTEFQTTTPAFGLVSIRSPHVLELQLIDPRTNTVLDKARILISANPAPANPTPANSAPSPSSAQAAAPSMDFSRNRHNASTDDCLDDPIMQNFFSNCTDVDFLKSHRGCSLPCFRAAADLQRHADLSLDCFEAYANTTLKDDTLISIKLRLAVGSSLCQTVYSGAHVFALPWAALFLSFVL